MPRRSAAAAQDTRRAILTRAVDVASVDGLEGMTIGSLAGDLAMSKAGVIGHFGSKQALQLAALDRAIALYTAQVWQPAEDAEPGLPRLLAICAAWTAHLGGGCFPGGCFLTGAAAEFDGRPGPIRDAVAKALRRWSRVLAAEARTAVAAGDLPTDTDPDQVAFELAALAAGANQAIQLHDDPAGADRALRAMQRVLGR